MGKIKRKTRYIPERGDIVWINFSPQSGHEQKGFRPGVVLTPSSYNGRAGLAILCPITSRKKGYSFEIDIKAGDITGAALADQIKSFDVSSRNILYLGKLGTQTLEEIADIAKELIG